MSVPGIGAGLGATFSASAAFSGATASAGAAATGAGDSFFAGLSSALADIAATLSAPFQYGFMVEAMLVGSLVGVVCAVISTYLILKGWSLMGDAISHSMLPGIVGAYVLGLPLALGAFAAGVATAGLTGWIKSNSRIKEDSVLGVVFTGFFALGLVLFSSIQTDVHLNHILFGNLLGIEEADKIQAIAISAVCLVVLLVLRKDLLLYLFDPAQARASGLNPTLLHYVFLVLVSATIVAALQAVGILLTIAMLIIPGAAAYLLTDRFDRMLLVAVASSVLSAVAGVYASFYLNGSTGACIVLVEAIFFVFAMFFGRKYGILSQRRRARLARRAAKESADSAVRETLRKAVRGPALDQSGQPEVD